MFVSPLSLEELCLDAVAEHINKYIVPLKKNNNWCYLGSDTQDEKYVFRDSEIFLIQQISEKLFCKLLDKGLLEDSIINIFSGKNTKLRNIRISDPRITAEGLQILNNHKITDLECVSLKNVSISKIIGCLNEWSQLHMLSASFPKCTFMDSSRHRYMVNIVNLKNLRSLNVAYTELNQYSFCIICNDLKHLEKLDISGTAVKNLAPLTVLSYQMKSIGLADLPNIANLTSVISTMVNLQHLELSIVNEKLENAKIDPKDCQLVKLLELKIILPKLKSLEISGWRDYATRFVLSEFITTHTHLVYLGIVLTDLMFEPAFNDVNHSDYPKHLVIGGLGNKEQIKVALKKYKDRASYVQKALYHLFQITNGSFPELCPKMFELVVPVMAEHSTKFGVQMAATACLYNLTKGDLSKHIHPNILSRGINLILDAMSHFPKDFQLQKNSLLTLCNDRILQDVNFDRFKCAWLVLDALCEFCDNNISRMAVAICSILAAKISTDDTSKLGARPSYMRKLLDMVENRVENVISDITLKFTLSALWNLTDESPATCSVFLKQQGAVLFLNVLQAFKDDSTIETKVLGLLNNIAEVAILRQSLMLDALISELYSLLKSENIDVSYFAAGIVAHLASDGEDQWSVVSYTMDEMLTELEESIMQWQVPRSEMVAYRSFKPFFPLLAVDKDYRVQLWALWAIRHVCTKNPKRYCAMLKEENGDELLNILIQSEYSEIEIRRNSSEIIETLRQHNF